LADADGINSTIRNQLLQMFYQIMQYTLLGEELLMKRKYHQKFWTLLFWTHYYQIPSSSLYLLLKSHLFRLFMIYLFQTLRLEEYMLNWDISFVFRPHTAASTSKAVTNGITLAKHIQKYGNNIVKA
jgi:hypothetical protein